ncbi:MAG: gamma carbonic anhydrase family protein [Gammaproteobacteria bacterium]|jgi:carbonic anhydrase/acetyltransferase-like protein (isoleucine patch superfamily)
MSIRSYQGIQPTIAEDAYIDPQACVIGKVTIGSESSVWPMAVVRGDVHEISIGKQTSIQDGSVLHVTHDGPYTPGGSPLIIGDQVTVGHNVTLHACTIHNRVLIGMGAVILDKAVINSDIIIGAGTVVTPNTELESGYLYIGSPAKKLRRLSDSEMEFLTYSANNYVKLQQSYTED